MVTVTGRGDNPKYSRQLITIGNYDDLLTIPFLLLFNGSCCKEHALVWLKEHLKPSDIVVVRSSKVRRYTETVGKLACCDQANESIGMKPTDLVNVAYRQEEVHDAKMVVVSYNLITDPWMQPEQICQNELKFPCSEFERCRS